jgi:hypothetical protein
MLWAAHTARVLPPPWTSRKIPMICSSLNRLLFIGSAPSKGAELHFSTVLFQGVRPAELMIPEKLKFLRTYALSEGQSCID